MVPSIDEDDDEMDFLRLLLISPGLLLRNKEDLAPLEEVVMGAMGGAECEETEFKELYG